MKNKMIDTILSVTHDTIDIDKLKSDETLIDEIALNFPKDGLVNLADLEKLAGTSMYGINICDYWVPILMVIIGDLESKKNKAKSKAYIEAESNNNSKLTAELRKAYSEIDPTYLKISSDLERVKAIKKFFEDKRDSFKTFHFFMKDQQKVYINNGGRNINGDDLEINKKEHKAETKKTTYESEEEF